MQVRAARLSLYSAGLALIAMVTVSGCAAGSSAGAGAGGLSAAPANPLAAVQLAAKTTGKVNSFTATMNIQVTPGPGASSTSVLSDPVQMTMAFAEQVHPTLLISADIEMPNVAGMPTAGGLSEIITPTTMYIKWGYITQQLHVA